jgi:hypothetical protein
MVICRKLKDKEAYELEEALCRFLARRHYKSYWVDVKHDYKTCPACEELKRHPRALARLIKEVENP